MNRGEWVRLSTEILSCSLSYRISVVLRVWKAPGRRRVRDFFGTIFRIDIPSLERAKASTKAKQESIFSMLNFSVFIVAVGEKSCFMESRLIRQMSVVN